MLAPAPSLVMPDPFVTLSRFHDDIRRALGEVRELSRASDDESGALGRRAARLLAFFQGPLLWHENDEELILLPHLIESGVRGLEHDGDVLAGQHDAYAPGLYALTGALEQIVVGHARAGLQRLRLAIAPFEHALLSHLMWEERSVFPRCRALLSVEHKAAIARDLALVAEARAESDGDG